MLRPNYSEGLEAGHKCCTEEREGVGLRGETGPGNKGQDVVGRKAGGVLGLGIFDGVYRLLTQAPLFIGRH